MVNWEDIESLLLKHGFQKIDLDAKKEEYLRKRHKTKVAIGIALLMVLSVSVAYAVTYLTQTLNMSFKLKTTYGLRIEDVSNNEVLSYAWGEFDYSQKKNATSIDHLRNTSTEAIIVRYSVSVPSGWSIKVYLASSVWQPSNPQSIAYGSTLKITIELTAPSSGQSNPQTGSVTFSVVDA